MDGLRYARVRAWVVVGVAFVLLLPLVAPAAHAHEQPWTSESEAGVDSADASEPDILPIGAPNPNLCEGTFQIPFGGDPSWVRVGGSPDPNTPFVEARGQLLPDLSGDDETNPFITAADVPIGHYTKDINAFMTLDPPFRHLLAKPGNFHEGGENEHSVLEVELERGGVPTFAFPGAGDRMTVWGTHIFDCGHSDGGFRTEIHPPVGWVLFRNTAVRRPADHDRTPPGDKRDQDPWVWYQDTDRQGMGTTLPSTPLHNTPVQATVADAFFSTFGGNAPESLDGCRDGGFDGFDAPCMLVDGQQWFQPLRNQDYTFFVPAPRSPGGDARMVWEADDRCGEVPANPGNPALGDVEEVGTADDTAKDIGSATCDIPDDVFETTENGQPGIRVTVKAQSGGSGYPANHYLAFAKRYKVAWDATPPADQRVRTFAVNFSDLHVYDDADECTTDGEWVMSLRVNENWIHPVRGHGDSDAPFWTDGAIDDDKCIPFHTPGFKGYKIGEQLQASVVPGEDLYVWERSYDLDNSTLQTNDVNPVMKAFPDPNRIPTDGSSVPFEEGTPDTGVSGGHTVLFQVRDVSPRLPSPGQLMIAGQPAGGGDPPVVTPDAPIVLEGSDGARLQYRVWPDGAAPPAGWQESDSMRVDLSGSGEGLYTIEYAPISAQGVLAERRTTRVLVGTPRYDAVWDKRDDGEVQLYDAPFDQFSAKYSELWGDGWRLASLAPTVSDNQVRYTAVWRQTSEAETQVYGYTYDDYRATYDQLWDQGWRLKLLSTYVLDGQVRYTAVWQASTDGERQVYGYTFADFVAANDQMAGEGWSLKLIATYVVDGQVRYTAAWREGGTDSPAVFGWTYQDYRAKYDELWQDGWRLRLLNETST